MLFTCSNANKFSLTLALLCSLSIRVTGEASLIYRVFDTKTKMKVSRAKNGRSCYLSAGGAYPAQRPPSDRRSCGKDPQIRGIIARLWTNQYERFCVLPLGIAIYGSDSNVRLN